MDEEWALQGVVEVVEVCVDVVEVAQHVVEGEVELVLQRVVGVVVVQRVVEVVEGLELQGEDADGLRIYVGGRRFHPRWKTTAVFQFCVFWLVEQTQLSYHCQCLYDCSLHCR